MDVTCDKGTGMWDYVNWSAKVSDFDSNTKCNVSFITVEEIELPTTITDLRTLTLMDSFSECTLGAGGNNNFYYTVPQDGVYTIVAYATGNASATAIYKNDVDISNTFLNQSNSYSSSFTFLSESFQKDDTIKVYVKNQGGGYPCRKYWIYR